MKSDRQVLYEALRTSLSASVTVHMRENFKELWVVVRNKTDHGTPVKKRYRLTMEDM